MGFISLGFYSIPEEQILLWRYWRLKRCKLALSCTIDSRGADIQEIAIFLTAQLITALVQLFRYFDLAQSCIVCHH
jgi:hypothetical protein